MFGVDGVESGVEPRETRPFNPLFSLAHVESDGLRNRHKTLSSLVFWKTRDKILNRKKFREELKQGMPRQLLQKQSLSIWQFDFQFADRKEKSVRRQIEHQQYSIKMNTVDYSKTCTGTMLHKV
jgi:hypothetical protein